MRYDATTFPNIVQLWLDRGWLQSGHSLIEFGAQEFNEGTEAEICRGLSAFLGRPIDRVPEIRTIYEAIGVRYSSIDVDGTHGSTFFDLNSCSPPLYWRGVFDFVNNEGTIEHLVNPINGFQVAHEITKVGGVIRHTFPLIGWREHGFFYGTAKFYAHLLGDNGYEKLRAIAVPTGQTPFADALFESIDLKGNPIPPPIVTDLIAELIVRKTSDRPFVIGRSCQLSRRRFSAETIGRESSSDCAVGRTPGLGHRATSTSSRTIKYSRDIGWNLPCFQLRTEFNRAPRLTAAQHLCESAEPSNETGRGSTTLGRRRRWLRLGRRRFGAGGVR